MYDDVSILGTIKLHQHLISIFSYPTLALAWPNELGPSHKGEQIALNWLKTTKQILSWLVEGGWEKN